MKLRFKAPFHKLSFAIVGAGPSGIYAAKTLQKIIYPTPRIVIFEKLPCPFGLLRYGVAPDHQQVKNIQKSLRQWLYMDSIDFRGNASIGNQISVQSLKDNFSAVMYCQGGYEQMVPKNIPKAANIIQANDIVGWYNSHPQYSNNPINFQNINKVCILGNGNVSIDIIRVLAKKSALKHTDINPKALDAIASNSIKQFTIVGRRGVTQSAFSLKQLRQLKELPNVQIILLRPQIQKSMTESSQQQINDQQFFGLARLNKRKLTFLQTQCTVLEDELQLQKYKSDKIKVVLRYLLQPTNFNIIGQKLKDITCQRNQLVGPKFKQSSRLALEKQTNLIQTDLLIISTGYKAAKIGEQYDKQKGAVPSQHGVVKYNQQLKIGEYVSGWAKTGCKGVIDTSMLSVQQTINNIRIHHQNNLLKERDEKEFLRELTHCSSKEGFKRLERRQLQQGKRLGKRILKEDSIQNMLNIMNH